MTEKLNLRDAACDKNFWRTLFRLIVPITIQYFFAQAVNSADVLMLGYVGQSELSAVSLANQFQFILMGINYGISSGITIMASQYWGKKDTNSIQAVVGIALKICLAITGVIALGCILVPGYLMRLYTSDATLIEIGVSYLRVVGLSYVLSQISQIYQCMLRSCERAVLPTVVSTTALGLNVFLNAVFIFGLFGAPRLGVVGVALATLIARTLELLLCLWDASRAALFKLDLRIVFGRHRLLFKDFLTYSIPAVINDSAWTIAFSLYSSIMGHMNADIVAASSVATTVRELFTVVGYALCAVASVMLGNKVGENKLKEARVQASLFCYVTFGISILTGLCVLVVRPIVFNYFVLSERAAGYLSIMLYISTYYVIGQIMNTLFIAGIFRIGGNSRWGMICDIITMWVVSLPLGFISAFVLKLPPMVVYFILCLDEFWKIPAVIKYYKSEKWLKNITREYE